MKQTGLFNPHWRSIGERRERRDRAVRAEASLETTSFERHLANDGAPIRPTLRSIASSLTKRGSARSARVTDGTARTRFISTMMASASYSVVSLPSLSSLLYSSGANQRLLTV